jgi:hypothetical protein
MPIDEFHRRVAVAALRVVAEHGFALGGGNALIAHGIIDRQTEDVDLFTDYEEGVQAAADAAEDALCRAGLEAERRDKTAGLADVFPGMGDGLAEWLVTAPGGERMMLQIAYFDRKCAPVIMDIGPVLHVEDVGGKVCALASRAVERDYLDTGALLDRYSVHELIGFARRLDPGLRDQDFADAGRRLDSMNDEVFARYGLGPQDVAALRRKLSVWPRQAPPREEQAAR